MKLSIKDFCVRCGICIDICPELYEMDYEGDVIRIRVDEVPDELMDRAKESIRDCAVSAIHFTKGLLFPEGDPIFIDQAVLLLLISC